MRTAVPEKLIAIADEIQTRGHANLTRLTVLKKWFEAPDRLPAFGLWVARRSAGRKGKAKGATGALLDEARTLLGTTATHERIPPALDRRTLKTLHDRARALQNEFEQHQWGAVRIIHCWPLLLVEKGIELHLGIEDSPAAGYKLAADLCQNYDPRYGTGLNGPSRTKIMEIVRFMFTLEALEEDGDR